MVSWSGNMRKPAAQPFIDAMLASSAPPWKGVSSRAMARRLGVSLQVLANWRVRDVGPEHERAPRGRGNKMLYRPDMVAAWLADGTPQPWEFTADWLQRRGMSPPTWTEASTRQVVARLEALDVFGSQVVK